MSISRFLIVMAIAGFAWHWWNGREAAMGAGDAANDDSPNGFVAAAMPDGAPRNTVVIFAPLNCPSDGAQRADSLAEQLTRRGIPIVRSSHFSIAGMVNPSAAERATVDRAVRVVNGEVPAVFVNGMAKANPSLEEAAAEYQRTR